MKGLLSMGPTPSNFQMSTIMLMLGKAGVSTSLTPGGSGDRRCETPPAGLTEWTVISYTSSGLFTFLFVRSSRQVFSFVDNIYWREEALPSCGCSGAGVETLGGWNWSTSA